MNADDELLKLRAECNLLLIANRRRLMNEEHPKPSFRSKGHTMFNYVEYCIATGSARSLRLLKMDLSKKQLPDRLMNEYF